MVCYLSCGLAIALILGTLFVNIYSHYNNEVVKKYRSLLTPEQDNIYKEIVNERLRIYMTGQLLGLLLGLLYLFTSKQNFSVCMFLFIVMLTQYFYYTLTPKQKWMLDYLTTPEQVSAWLDVYKQMMKLYHLGVLFGIIGYFILAKSFLSKTI